MLIVYLQLGSHVKHDLRDLSHVPPMTRAVMRVGDPCGHQLRTRNCSIVGKWGTTFGIPRRTDAPGAKELSRDSYGRSAYVRQDLPLVFTVSPQVLRKI
jgi:hypothetical protein